MSLRRGRRRTITKTIAFSAWMIVVAIVLLWQTVSYRGAMAVVGEWQYNTFGRQYPTFNFVFLVFALTLPGYLLFLKPRTRSSSEQPEAATFRSALTLLKVMFGAAIGFGAATLVTLAVMLTLPGSTGVVQRIDLANPNLLPPREGPTQISGSIIYERTAGFDEDLLLTRRTYRFAPIVGSRQNANDVQFFVQIPPVDDQSRRGTTTMNGVLKRNGLPGELVRLFRYAGFNLTEPHYVLYAEPTAMRWPYLMTMVQFMIGALLALIIGLLQQRRVRSIDRDIHEPVAQETVE
jgi:hypothetical protein